MKLLTKELRERLPGLYETEDLPEEETTVHAKFFTPDSNWTWYVIEYGGDGYCFGLVKGQYTELGYFHLQELEEARGPLGLPIERDLYFKPLSLAELKARLARGEHV